MLDLIESSDVVLWSVVVIVTSAGLILSDIYPEIVGHFIASFLAVSVPIDVIGLLSRLVADVSDNPRTKS
jgi:hypothetical protein